MTQTLSLLFIFFLTFISLLALFPVAKRIVWRLDVVARSSADRLQLNSW